MKITRTSLDGVVIVEPLVHRDDRGFFLELEQDERFAEYGLPSQFVQANWSRSARHVLRGLHYQREHAQGKLVTVVHGRVYDVAVDIRRGSPTFGQWTAVTLDASTPTSLWIPPGFAHGFCTLSESADVVYFCTERFYPNADRGVLWCDERLGIAWPLSDPVLSARDQQNAPFDPESTELPEYTL